MKAVLDWAITLPAAMTTIFFIKPMRPCWTILAKKPT